MRAAVAFAMSTLAALPLCAQVPKPERAEGCVNALLITGERHDYSTAPGGRGGALDWIGCLPRTVYAVGVGSVAVADTHWTLGKLGAAWHAAPNAWLAADVKAGSGRGPAGTFAYLNVVDSLTLRLAEPIFVRAEHQYIRIAAERGHIFKLAGVYLPWPFLALEAGAARSGAATFDTRQYSGRVDWVHARGRLFAGGAHGRSLPVAVDLVSGTRPPDAVTRQWFAGASHMFGDIEFGLVFDTQSGAGSTRRTWTGTMKALLP